MLYYQSMPIPPQRETIYFDHPATYRIIVQGGIAPEMSDHLEGMTIQQGRSVNDSPITTLEGKLSDQAALAGVLNTIYNLHMLVLSVECLNIAA
jgi:hypothetical protein